MLAKMAKVPELELDKAEANLLAQAAAKVAEHYDFLGGALSERTAAWLGLGQAAALVYGPRIIARRASSKKPVSDAPGAPAADNIMSLFPGVTP